MKSMPTQLEDARRVLGECPLFRGLAVDERDELIARAHLRKFAPGDTVFLMGSPGDSMMAVLSGSIRISVPSPEGKEIVLAILEPGEIFGEIAVLDGKERSADAKAITESSCLAVLTRRDVTSFLERHPSAWSSLVGILCERLRRTDQQFAEVALMEVPIRLAKALLRLTTPNAQLEIHLSQRELGGMVGATRESVNKCLREWQQRGVVRVEEAVIKIDDREALQEVSELGLEPGTGYASRPWGGLIPETRAGVDRERCDFHMRQPTKATAHLLAIVKRPNRFYSPRSAHIPRTLQICCARPMPSTQSSLGPGSSASARLIGSPGPATMSA